MIVRNASIIALCVSLLSACDSPTAADFEAVRLPPSVDKAARDQVKASLKDPSSAQFQNVRGFAFSGGGYVVCGSVNARNSYGGYGGFKPFRTSVGTGAGASVYIDDLPSVVTPCDL